VFKINLIFSLAEDFSYFLILFPPFFMRVLNNYFYDSMFYYSEIEENYVPQMTIFSITWTLILIFYLKYFSYLKLICSKATINLSILNNSEFEKINIEIQIEKNFIIKNVSEEKKQIIINRKKINIITGDNHSGKSNILKQIASKIPKSHILYILYILTKGKGVLFNLTLEENICFFKFLFKSKNAYNKKVNSNENLLNNQQKEKLDEKSYFFIDKFRIISIFQLIRKISIYVNYTF
jgi:hypothetical protein